MSNMSSELTFQKSDCAELNSLLLFDYEYSFMKFYNHIKKDSLHSNFYKWFEHSKFDNSTNAFLKDYEDYFYKSVFK